MTRGYHDIGGNDAGFASTVISCTISSDAACLQTIADDLFGTGHVNVNTDQSSAAFFTFATSSATSPARCTSAT